MSVVIIINPIAGGSRSVSAEGRRRAELASSLLASQRVDGDVLVTERRGHARELAAAAVARGVGLLIAWGGDGTVNEVGCAVAHREASLGIVPSGSGNGLARALGVARRPAQALIEALAATPRRIDAGELGGRLFFSTAGVGFDAHVAACFDRDRSGRRGFSTYARIVLRELARYRPLAYRVEAGGSVREVRALLVTLANAPGFGNGADLAPGARVDDGRLDLVVFEERSRLRTVFSLPRLFTGAAASVPGVTIQRVDRALVDGEGPLNFQVDGEPSAGASRLKGVVHPGALSVCVR
jgi:YegS/Rv2252/BmrU family lipid kinase